MDGGWGKEKGVRASIGTARAGVRGPAGAGTAGGSSCSRFRAFSNGSFPGGLREVTKTGGQWGDHKVLPCLPPSLRVSCWHLHTLQGQQSHNSASGGIAWLIPTLRSYLNTRHSVISHMYTYTWLLNMLHASTQWQKVICLFLCSAVRLKTFSLTSCTVRSP